MTMENIFRGSERTGYQNQRLLLHNDLGSTHNRQPPPALLSVMPSMVYSLH